MAKKGKVTPLMKQYQAIKQKHPEALLLFRVGDFYETFGQDAVRTAEVLDIVLTHRNNGGDQTELAGFPHHALNTYLPKLVRAGERVAICDQLEDPKQTKTIVKRGVTELVTPGVALHDDILEKKSNNYLASLFIGRQKTGLALLDISTGEFLTTEGSLGIINKLLQQFAPSEILMPRTDRKKIEQGEVQSSAHPFYLDGWVYSEDYALETLTRHFKTKSLQGFGIQNTHAGVLAAGAILHYLSETQHKQLSHINRLQPLGDDRHLWMDRFTLLNLELFSTARGEGTPLLQIIDHTHTPMGGRMLKRWLAFPLTDRSAIEKRLEAVELLFEAQQNLNESELSFGELEDALKQIGDLERYMAKVATAKIQPREFLRLAESLAAVQKVHETLSAVEKGLLKELQPALKGCPKLEERLSTAIDQEAPAIAQKGGIFAKGYSEELDALREKGANSKSFLDALLKREVERTGITSLKIASNNVFGYYIEVRNTHKDKVPEEWIRKQTLVNAERYITEELKEYEVEILGAEEKIAQLEEQLYTQLITFAQQHIQEVQGCAQAIAQVDVLSSHARLAYLRKYKKPVLLDSGELRIAEGRHPVIETQLPPGEDYIANDVLLDQSEQQLLVITGPNMSGKSALLRQTALIVILAQMGSFVPAERAELGIVDRLFTRVGASDNLSKGESTFMVEMNETASIMNNLSDRSLLLMDEIGRGTSTYDGISIAWAICEYLHEHPSKPKTLFATHYHELNELTHRFDRIKNFNVAVEELKDKVLFLRKLVPGGSAHSFGIHVARMAGMPSTIVKRADKLLIQMESSPEKKETPMSQVAEEEMQLSFFQLDDPLLEEIKEEILDLNIDNLTPVEALMKLNEIKRLLSRSNKAIS
ncbi:DNA mismatch repair protein MutS [Aureicoccus marinus]|uniref:DNA mismatch repair protein MutS n=1 Tax=Aureicoccus marinus TaxID=754435 RepID=A0A2S7T783_9FLAO|nr:DNA mismatch repair protein MutS [Aureicoccus marinus]PQJ15770.1 DNA mismatch repair protein MutS [Aureicoccus marinus]